MIKWFLKGGVSLYAGFLPGIFSEGIYCHANFFCYANFAVAFGPNFLGDKSLQGGKLLLF